MYPAPLRSRACFPLGRVRKGLERTSVLNGERPNGVYNIEAEPGRLGIWEYFGGEFSSGLSEPNVIIVSEAAVSRAMLIYVFGASIFNNVFFISWRSSPHPPSAFGSVPHTYTMSERHRHMASARKVSGSPRR
eukprot:scaffold9550_cov111-Isochrysis_galbana.AAC.4